MEDKLRELLVVARQKLQSYGLNLTGLHYFVTGPEQRSQKKRQGLAVCFDVVTDNPYFFGFEYKNLRRVQLVEIAFEAGFEFLSKAFPGFEVWLDLKVNLKRPFKPFPPFSKGGKLKEKSVDVTGDNDVYFVTRDELLVSGQIETDCTLDQYANRYGLDKILKHGWHCISPDSSSVEAFEAICDMQKIYSVLEIGAGVGICGVAAQRRGVKDFTFVDTSPVVCSYLEDKFPGYNVIQGSALEFNFDRDWDIALIGIPYEMSPWFLSEKGAELAKHCGIVVFQSGCSAFFQHEHEWVYGNQQFIDWPWWNKKQTLSHYFPVVFGSSLDWQTCIVGGKYLNESLKIMDSMKARGFSPIRYKYIYVV